MKKIVFFVIAAIFFAGHSDAQGLSESVKLYRTKGYSSALSEAKRLADATLAKTCAEVSPADVSALVELSRYVGAVERDRYRSFAARCLEDADKKRYCETYKTLEKIAYDGKLAAKIKPLLPSGPYLPGSGDIAGWNKLARTPQAAKIVSDAEKLLSEPIADTSDELYLRYWKNGNRTDYQKRLSAREMRLTTLTLAESLERKGRFIPALTEIIDAICSMKSWVLPAHDWSDGRRGNFNGTVLSVDLRSSDIAATLAYSVNFLRDSLPAETVAKIKKETERRVFAPLRLSYSLAGKSGRYVKHRDPMQNWWISGNNNWNAVCHCNLVIAALGLLDDDADRALFVAYAIRALPYYARSGFTSDGYCSEGMGYWNYGFGHFLRLGLTLRDVSGGKIDVFKTPVYRKAAEYAFSYQLEKGISPAFSDGNGAPSPTYLLFVYHVWPDLVSDRISKVTPFGTGVSTLTPSIVSLLGFGKVSLPTNVAEKPLPPRSEFPVGQVWLMRDGCDLSVAVKGGHNDEHHNHNDIGSYYLVSRGKLLSGDPGNEVYTSRTFSSRRYVSKVLSSYAHPVPVVDGKLQSTGRKFAAKVLKTDFTPERDTIVLDIKGAYGVKSLVSLVRTFVFDRVNDTFSVTDRVEFSEPSAFADVYTTFEGEEFGEVDVDVIVTKGGETRTSKEHIANPGRIEPERHLVEFVKPVTEAEMTFRFKAR